MSVAEEQPRLRSAGDGIKVEEKSKQMARQGWSICASVGGQGLFDGCSAPLWKSKMAGEGTVGATVASGREGLFFQSAHCLYDHLLTIRPGCPPSLSLYLGLCLSFSLCPSCSRLSLRSRTMDQTEPIRNPGSRLFTLSPSITLFKDVGELLTFYILDVKQVFF